MSNYLEINPLDKTPLISSINKTPNIPINVAQGDLNLNNLQSVLQFQVLNKVMSNMSFLQSGNPMIDTAITTLMQTLIITLVSVFVSKMGSIYNFSTTFALSSVYWVLNVLKLGLFYGLNKVKSKIFKGKKVIKKINRTVDIPYITDNRQINELYKAVFWYLTNDSDIDYNLEPYLQYVFDKKITSENKEKIMRDLSIHKILTKEKTKTIKYKNYDITYSLSTELITVYTDKDRKRENFKVTLTTKVDEIDKNDVLEEFCQHSLTEYINNLTSSSWYQKLYTNVNGEWVATQSNNSRKLDTIILKNKLKDDIKNDIQLFLNSEEWYKERDIPYTRGYMFYGYPGTGKTSMIKGLSLYSKRHIHSLILSDVKSDTELMNLLKNINYKETILVIEDIDATLSIVKSRDIENKKHNHKKDDSNKDDNDDSEKKKKETNSSVSLSGLLNAIDGVFTCYGRILVLTTNHPEVLDSALIRPGRIDSKYLFDNCDKKQINKYLFLFLFNLKRFWFQYHLNVVMLHLDYFYILKIRM